MADEYTINFKENLKAKRRILTIKQRKKTETPKRKRWIYPRSQERKYYSVIRKLLTIPMKQETKNTLDRNLNRWIEEKQRTDKELERHYKAIKKTPYISDIPNRNDQYPDEIREMGNRQRNIANANIGTTETPPEQTELWSNLSIIADVVFEQNQKQWNKQTSNVLGFEYRMTDFWWQDLKRTWILENFEHIRGMSEEYIRRISETINRGIRNGLSIAEIIKEVNKTNKAVFQNKASLIAVDQIGKLNGQITKKRNLAIGLKEYIWRTQRDEKVRGNPKGKYPKAIPSHWIMEGKICNWLDDTIYAEQKDIDLKTGKINWKKRITEMPRAIPGEQFRCRCIGEPFWNSIIKSVDEEIEKEERQ